ncbi:MAG: type III ribulose-bisphosphate carboxylase [Candidatus Nanoarchaeia archaeon]|nr:type III ribulose-bisphosphate carboxylase [Candidatus Nanoarchaeia archaeon]MDD5499575.1 type III ribulose-bisphosphate carboxylase [Candidatus Nanoarchaeia archaeon]
MIMKYEDFIDLKYAPNNDELICLFRITPSKDFTIKDAAIRVAAESSNGTWSNLKVPKHILKLKATVFDIKNDFVKIAYPLDLFEKGNMSQILSSIAGNVFGMKAVNGLRLEDVHWPKKLLNSFKGPGFGLNGVQKIFKTKRTLTATVPKPKVGYYPDEHAKVGFDAWVGGVDLLKDDENLSDQVFNRFEKRLDLSMKMRDKAEKLTGEKKSYLINITAETHEMLRRMDLVKKSGNEYVMIDILTAGWAATQTICDKARELGLAVHGHRAFHATFDRNPLHGMSMKIICEIARLQGVDQLHIGAMGKLVGGKQEVRTNFEKASLMKNKEENLMLAQDWGSIKPMVGVCSGGLHPGIIKPVFDLLGTEIALQVGGGIQGHPDGTEEGAKAVRESIDAYNKGISLKEYSKTHPALRKAYELWGEKVYE